MAKRKKMPFESLAIQRSAGIERTTIVDINGKRGCWIDPCFDAIAWDEYIVYGISNSEEEIEKAAEGDLSSATRIGKIEGCHIAKSLIVNLGDDPYITCDGAHADLEAMYSVLQEYKPFAEEECFVDDIYYIQEIEMEPEYQKIGYEKALLLQLPAILVKQLHVFPSLLIYFPRPTHRDEPERDEEAEAILLHRINYATQNITTREKDDNVIIFPPKCAIPEKEINRVLGRRNPGESVPEAYRDNDVYKLYKSAGFKQINKTGWLCKHITSIDDEDESND